MKKNLILLALIAHTAHAAPKAAPLQTYICMNHGKPVYTTVKLNKSCQVSQMNGIADSIDTATAASASAPAASTVTDDVALTADTTPTASEPAVPQIINDEIAAIWNRNEFGSYDDTVILPPSAPVTGGDSGGKLNVNLRHNIPRVSPKIVLPPKPTFTRRQILQQEIDRERAALKTAENQLNNARGRNDLAAAKKYAAQVNDRRQNLIALEAEFRR